MRNQSENANQLAKPFTAKGAGCKVEVMPGPGSEVTPLNMHAFLDLLTALEGSQRLHILLNRLFFAYLQENEGVWPDEHDDLFELRQLTEFVSALYRKPSDVESEFLKSA